MPRYLTHLALACVLTPAALMAQSLPEGTAIMDKYIQATGGLKAYAAKQSIVMKGTMDMGAMGMKGPVTIYKAEPNLSLMEVEFEGIGKIREGFDGKVAWGTNPMQGPRIKSGDELTAAENEAVFHSEHWNKLYKQLQTQGTETVDGEPCYKVLATPHKGEPTTLYFNVKTGLLVKSQAKLKTAMGEMTAESITKDYKKVGDLLLPHTQVQSVAGQVFTLTFQSMEWNTPLPKSHFAVPPEVKALIKP